MSGYGNHQAVAAAVNHAAYVVFMDDESTGVGTTWLPPWWFHWPKQEGGTPQEFHCHGRGGGRAGHEHDWAGRVDNGGGDGV